jgi:hypothetical protein
VAIIVSKFADIADMVTPSLQLEKLGYARGVPQSARQCAHTTAGDIWLEIYEQIYIYIYICINIYIYTYILKYIIYCSRSVSRSRLR